MYIIRFFVYLNTIKVYAIDTETSMLINFQPGNDLSIENIIQDIKNWINRPVSDFELSKKDLKVLIK